MDVLMLAYFTTASCVGYYSLAGAIATASGFPVVGFSTALFHRMVRHGQIERRWLLGSGVVGLATAGSSRPLLSTGSFPIATHPPSGSLATRPGAGVAWRNERV